MNIKINVSRGSSLIEVMVAVFVMAVGMLGVLGMQTRSVQLNQNAYLYSQAAILAEDLMEIMQTSSVQTGVYSGFSDDVGSLPAASGCVGGANCSESEIAEWSYGRWLANVEQILPDGSGQVEAVSGNYRIVVKFTVGFNANNDLAIPGEVKLDVGS